MIGNLGLEIILVRGDAARIKSLEHLLTVIRGIQSVGLTLIHRNFFKFSARSCCKSMPSLHFSEIILFRITHCNDFIFSIDQLK